MNAITFSHVDKYFYLQHQKTIKELAQAFFKKEKTIERLHALRDVSFTMRPGESVGIIGKNGAGKSTILKLIARVSAATSGEVIINGRVSPLIELGAGFHPELSGRDNVYMNGVILGLSEKEIDRKYSSIVEFSGLKKFMDVPVKRYSSGMYTRLAFSVAVSIEPDILLIDEVLSVGDAEFNERCMNRMNEFKKRGVTIVMVSHSLNSVGKFCHRALYLEKGTIKYDGDPQKAIDIYMGSSEEKQ